MIPKLSGEEKEAKHYGEAIATLGNICFPPSRPAWVPDGPTITPDEKSFPSYLEGPFRFFFLFIPGRVERNMFPFSCDSIV